MTSAASVLRADVTVPTDLGFVRTRLADAGVDDVAIADYVRGLLEDEGMDENDKRDAVREFLEAAGSSSSQDESFLDDLFARFNEAVDRARVATEQARLEATVAVKEKEKMALVVAASEVAAGSSSSSSSSSNSRQQMTPAERMQREALLEQYGYEADDVVETEDGEVEFLYKDRSEGGTHLAGLGENRNAQTVAEKEQHKRAEAKDQHQRMLLRQKELEQREKERKEKARKRTEKHERHRG